MLQAQLNWFLDCYSPHKKIVSFVVLGSLIGAGLGLLSPMMIRYIMDELLPNGISANMVAVSAGLLLVYASSYYLNYKIECLGRGMGARIEFSMREKLFRHMLRMGYSYYDNAQSGQLLSRLVNDIAEVGNLMFAIPHLFVTCTITMIGSIGLLFYLNWQLATIVTALLLFKTWQAATMNRDMKKMFMQARQNTGDLSGQISESLNGIRLVKTFNTEERELDKMLKAGESLLSVQEDSFKTVGRLHGGMDFFSNLMNLVITVIGGVLISLGMMTVSDLVAFLLYMMICMRPVFQLMMLTETYQRGMAGVYRYQELMNLPESGEVSANRTAHLESNVDSQGIEFSHVKFSYDNGTPIFNDFNLKIEAGEHVGIVGMTGGGKTTLCELLLGMYDLNGGSISIDGKDITTLRMDSLRRDVGMIQQDTFLFSASVKDNIAYGRPNATDEEIVNAAKLAEADEFIKDLPSGYDTFIGERGVKLSGGQKQRLAIARMFLRNPKILILDEATSALDNETERLVQKAMQKLSENRTTITVAHRLATIQNSDRILVLEKGNITEEGTHEDLLERHGVYFNLSQNLIAA
ncbi:MAG: ABC transporter ATP-binding protein [Selenomonadaceae bacterium]|nr:ABC transporter ATP-binding protein [Selenomonadaceae bacterium]